MAKGELNSPAVVAFFLQGRSASEAAEAWSVCGSGYLPFTSVGIQPARAGTEEAPVAAGAEAEVGLGQEGLLVW